MKAGDPEPVFLIDASSYLYRAYHALPPLTAPDGLPVQVVFGCARMLLKLLRIAQPHYVAAVFDAPGRTFRDELFADYKANRPPMPDELAAQIPLVQEVTAAFGIPCLVETGVEADDVIATLTERCRRLGYQVVIVSGDKDLLQLVRPGIRVWDTMSDRWYDTAAVEQKLGVQPSQVVDFIALMGDPVDNIPGVKGIGEVTARRLLQRFGSVEEILLHLAEIAEWRELRGAGKIARALGENREAVLLGKQLARVRTDVPCRVELDQLVYRGVDLARLRPLFARLGFDSLLRELPQGSAELPRSVRCARSQEDVDAYLHNEPRDALVGVAILRTEQGRVSVMALSRHDPLCVPEGVESPGALLQRLWARDAAAVAGHDLKTDLRTAGAEQLDTGSTFDAMVAAYLLECPVPSRFEEVLAHYLGARLPPFRSTVETTAAALQKISSLRDRLDLQLKAGGVLELFREVEMPLAGVLARMESYGVLVDVGALQALGADLERRMAALTAAVFELAGGEFNLSSPQQLREVLFERLQLPTRGVRRGKTGLSTDVDVLTRLAELHPLPRKILDYRTLAKLKSTYVDGLLNAVDEHGRLHTSFNQCVTATGRLSSSDPNLQNIPVRGEEGSAIRACFVAPPGRRLLVADYSQIELRLLAHFSADPVLCNAFARQEDIHARTAAEVFGVAPGLVSREMRRVAKIINFGILYGMGAASLARQLGVSVAEAERYIENYFVRYSGVRDYIQRSLREARERGFVTTILGRRRSVPALRSQDRAAVQAAERIAMNTPIQGSAADLIKLAMVKIDRQLRAEHWRATMVLQVHDELVFEVDEAHLQPVQALVRSIMQEAIPLRVPLVVETAVGKNWLDAHP